MLPYFPYPKSCYTLQGKKIKKNHDNWLKNKKVIQCQKMPKKLKFFYLKIDKGAGISNKPKNFLNKGTKN